MAKALASPDLRAWLDENALITIASTPEQLAAMHKKGLETYGQIIKLAGIKAE